MPYLILILLSLCSTHLYASPEIHQFANPEQESQYQEIIHNLRCLVCQNQSIAESNAALATDLKLKVYEMLTHGENEKYISAFMKQRYGDFVLYKPQVSRYTVLLWLAPVIFLLLAIMAVWKLKLIDKEKHGESALDSTLSEQIRLETDYDPLASKLSGKLTLLVFTFILISSYFLYLGLGDPDAEQKQELQKTAILIKNAIPDLVQYLSIHPEDKQAWLHLEQAYRFLQQDALADRIIKKLHEIDETAIPMANQSQTPN